MAKRKRKSPRSIKRPKSKRRKRKAPKMTRATALKIIKNPNTPPHFKAYWKKQLPKLK